MSSAPSEISKCLHKPQQGIERFFRNSKPQYDRKISVLRSTGTCEGDVRSRLLPWINRNTGLMPLLYGEFWISAAYSLMQPFFPILATSKNLPAWKYGFVFSVFKISMLFGSQISQPLMKRTSPTTCYFIGQVGFFLFNIIFGCLYWIPDGNTLLGVSIASVLVGGFTNMLYLVSAYSIVTNQYPKSGGVVIAFLDFIWAIGNMVGSAVGGTLIDLWAYPLPFFVFGTLIIFSIPWIVKYRATFNQDPGTSCSEGDLKEDGKSYWSLLLDPLFFNNMVTVMTAWLIMGYNEPTLEPSLKEFGLGVKEIGEVFATQFASCSVGALLAGALCHLEADAFCAVVGHCFGACAYLVLEPASFILFERSLWMIYLSQVLTGLSMALMFVCGYYNALKIVGFRGYPNTIHTKAFLSSTVFTAQVLGGIVMPPIAGRLVGTLGFRKASMIMLGILTTLLRCPTTFTAWIGARHFYINFVTVVGADSKDALGYYVSHHRNPDTPEDVENPPTG